MKRMFFMVLPLVFLFAAANVMAQNEPKKEHGKEHHEAADTSKKEACCSTEEKGDDCCSTEAGDAHEHGDKAVKQVWNTVCPVSGEAIEAGSPTIEHEGKLVALCCPGCESKFKKDPAKFMKNLSPDGKKFLKKS